MKNLERILRLIQKTGDKYIVEDAEGNVFVVLGIGQYEDLAAESPDYVSEDVIAKINHDISMWRKEHEKDIEAIVDQSDTATEDKYYFEPET